MKLSAALASFAAIVVLAITGCGASGKTSATTDAGSTPPEGSAPTDPAPLPNEGTKAVALGVPATKGGNGSISAYGLESASTERVHAAASAKAYLDARAAGHWGLACADLASALRSRLERPYEQEDNAKRAGCERVMRTRAAGESRGKRRAAAEIYAISMRVRGRHGFLLYRDRKGTVWGIPMSREGDKWRVAATLTGFPLSPGR